MERDKFIVVLFLLGVCIIGHLLAGEFRFCHNGPQRIRYEDCPGGFISKKPIQPNCIFYHRAKDPIMKVSYSRNVCDYTTYIPVRDAQSDFPENGLQLFRFYDVSKNVTAQGDDDQPDLCNETCLVDYLEPKYWNPVPLFQDKPPQDDKDLEANQQSYIDIMKSIMIKIVHEDEYDKEEREALIFEPTYQENESEERHNIDAISDHNKTKETNWTGIVNFLYLETDVKQSPMSSLLLLLAKVMRVTYRHCMPYLEPSFYTLVFRTMQEFRTMAIFFPNMDFLPVRRIMDNLDLCEMSDNLDFQINGSDCNKKKVIKSIRNRNTSEIKAAKVIPQSFRWGHYDPIIEAAWSAVQFVHGYCFQFFEDDVLHFSMLFRGLNELFIQPVIQKHWINPTTVGKGLTLWETVYDTSDILNQMHNLDACITGGYMNSIFKHRLERPFTPEDAMKDPTFEDVTDIPQAGWTKSLEEYWKMYEKKGFQEMVDELGFCYSTEELVRDDAAGVIREICEQKFSGDD